MRALRPPLAPRRGFYQRESRMFCPCELCRLRFGRLLYPVRGGVLYAKTGAGMPLGMGWRQWPRKARGLAASTKKLPAAEPPAVRGGEGEETAPLP